MTEEETKSKRGRKKGGGKPPPSDHNVPPPLPLGNITETVTKRYANSKRHRKNLNLSALEKRRAVSKEEKEVLLEAMKTGEFSAFAEIMLNKSEDIDEVKEIITRLGTYMFQKKLNDENRREYTIIFKSDEEIAHEKRNAASELLSSDMAENSHGENGGEQV